MCVWLVVWESLLRPAHAGCALGKVLTAFPRLNSRFSRTGCGPRRFGIANAVHVCKSALVVGCPVSGSSERVLSLRFVRPAASWGGPTHVCFGSQMSGLEAGTSVIELVHLMCLFSGAECRVMGGEEEV